MERAIIDTLINWFPMLLLIAVWIFFLSRGGGWSRVQREAIERAERQAKALERIADALEKSAASR